MSGSPWDDRERVRQLHRLWHDGLGVSVIAGRLGVTVGAVTSKSRREGLPRRDNPTTPRLPRLPDKLPQVVGRRMPSPKVTLPVLESLKGLPVQSTSAMPSRNRFCCWPVTDGRPWRYCEAPTDGRTYCAKHLFVARFGSGGKASEQDASDIAADENLGRLAAVA